MNGFSCVLEQMLQPHWLVSTAAMTYLLLYRHLVANCGSTLYRMPPCLIMASEWNTCRHVRLPHFSLLIYGMPEYDYFLACGGTLRGDSGQVMTPDWPAPISQNLTCKWTLITRPGSRIQFNITDLDLAAGEQCSNNALDVSVLSINYVNFLFYLFSQFHDVHTCSICRSMAEKTHHPLICSICAKVLPLNSSPLHLAITLSFYSTPL